MVGPWLFWLGPMISVCFASSFPLAWHCFLLSCSGIAMTSHDGHLWRSGDSSQGSWEEGGRFRYLVDQWLVTMMNLYDAFYCGLLAGRTAC